MSDKCEKCKKITCGGGGLKFMSINDFENGAENITDCEK